jgi:hypothetical protein
MSRPFRGQESINAAQASLKAATTLGQLRQPQDVMLPLVYGLNLVQTAAAIGVPSKWASRLRNRFIAGHVLGDRGGAVGVVATGSASALSGRLSS